MSSRSLSPISAPFYKKLTLIAGNANTNGTSAPTAVSTKGATLARTGVGTYTLTMTDAYNAITSVFVDLSLGTAAAQFAIAGNPTAVSATSPSGAPITVWRIPITIINNSGTAVDVAAAAGNAIHWQITAHDSSTTQG